MSGILEGKVAIVTGAGRGIGRGIAEEFAAEGAHVVVASRSQGSVDAVVEAIRATGGKASGALFDAGVPDEVRAMVEETGRTFDRIDVLVNNAQSFGTREKPANGNPPAGLENFPQDQWDWVFATGFTGTMVAMQAAFPFMKEHGGSIINFGSGRGTLATPGTAAYNVTKEAVRTLSRSAANEWGQYGIRVNVMSPIIATDSFTNDLADPDVRQAFINTIPLRFVGDTREAGRVAVFLAGPDSRYMTGHTFMVDGGYTPRV